jgi:hypothetical protein
MNARTRALLCSTAKVVSRLVEECRKGSPLYTEQPKPVAQVSRTAKWLLNALAALQQAPSSTADSDSPK